MKGIYLANTFLDEFAVYHDERQTKVTFNNGGHWKQLVLPETTFDGTPIVCPDECALHLHLIGKEKQDIQPIRSQTNALGIVMAVGNVGRYLDTSHLRTYMSRDAGASWREVAEGSHVYEFGDHGGIIVMAPNSQLTNSLQYSLDEGHSWKECRFSGSALQVKNFLGSPNNTGVNFLLQGTRHKQDKKEAVVLHLNFSRINQRCLIELDQLTLELVRKVITRNGRQLREMTEIVSWDKRFRINDVKSMLLVGMEKNLNESRKQCLVCVLRKIGNGLKLSSFLYQ